LHSNEAFVPRLLVTYRILLPWTEILEDVLFGTRSLEWL
jgi:hypothetical protein